MRVKPSITGRLERSAKSGEASKTEKTNALTTKKIDLKDAQKAAKFQKADFEEKTKQVGCLHFKINEDILYIVNHSES